MSKCRNCDKPGMVGKFPHESAWVVFWWNVDYMNHPQTDKKQKARHMDNIRALGFCLH